MTAENLYNGSGQMVLPAPEPDDTSGGPNFNPKSMFMQNLSQEELTGLSGERLDEIYQKARDRAKRTYRGESVAVLKQQTLSHMEKIWERKE